MDFEEEILIPKARIAVLIGEKGATRRLLEKKGDIKLIINSNENVVTIQANDAVDLMAAKNVVEMIGRGFNPAVAQRLFKEEYGAELLNISDYAGRSKKNAVRLKGRVVGQEGKAQKLVEYFTKSNIAVFGKTVGIIAPHETLQIARRAVEMLLQGSEHATVFRMLEKQAEASR